MANGVWPGASAAAALPGPAHPCVAAAAAATVLGTHGGCRVGQQSGASVAGPAHPTAGPLCRCWHYGIGADSSSRDCKYTYWAPTVPAANGHAPLLRQPLLDLPAPVWLQLHSATGGGPFTTVNRMIITIIDF